jgi:hypothetical protein
MALTRPLTSRFTRTRDKFELNEYSQKAGRELLKTVDALLDGLVDYAGLFPPASEDMRAALENYASYRRGADRNALGRFIVPMPRLDELEAEAKELLPRGRGWDPWRLSVLVANDIQAAGAELLEFNRRHSAGSSKGYAVIDVAELKASTAAEIEHQRAALPRDLVVYFEIPHKGDVGSLVKAIARTGSRAKIRTGGVTADAFPPPREVIDFIVACESAGVAFKATAGLHHAIRGEYPLTYEEDSPTGTMHGFLNVFIAAALVHAGESEETAIAVLEENDLAAFSFSDNTISWRKKHISGREIAACRTDLAISFGSCSFREPVDELDSLIHAAHESR